MKNIKIGACEWGLPGVGNYAVRIAADFGIEALSLKIGTYENDYPLSQPDVWKYYLDDQQKYGIEFCAIALNDFDNIPMHARKDTPEYDIVWSMLRRAVPTAKALGAKVIQIPAFSKSEIKTEDDLLHSAAAFRYLCDEAAQYGISIASENVLTLPEFKTLYDAVDRKNFCLYFDSQNYYLKKNYDQIQMLNDLYPYMCNQLHVKDGIGYMSGSLLGKGNSGFFDTIKALSEHSFEGYILLENYYDQFPLRLEASNPYELLREDVRILKEAISTY